MQDTPTILVTGANGQVGKELRQLENEYPEYRFLFLSREDLPIHHFELVRNYFRAVKPRYLINCAAYTAVDKAESEQELAFQINAEAVGVLAAVCHEYGTKLLHLSTDYVFDGKGDQPYQPDTPTGPRSVYGASKLKGEEEARRFDPDCIIIRTSWVYSEFGKNFVKTMCRLMQEKEILQVVSDQYGSPTYAADLADFMLRLIRSGKWDPGIYHYCNQGVISWYDFARQIRDFTGRNCRITSVPSSGYPSIASRPAYSALDCSMTFRTWPPPAPAWEESLLRCLKRLGVAISGTGD
ncbi:MAG: dTDP-4-dehydrorhamnose reductase [Chitinophagaceae bacterium]|nr:dTDP-4-dehydrorhamnose reductase [Chitinophagaceae bacterium]